MAPDWSSYERIWESQGFHNLNTVVRQAAATHGNIVEFIELGMAHVQTIGLVSPLILVKLREQI